MSGELQRRVALDGSVNLQYDRRVAQELGYYGHPQKVMKDLGISSVYALPQSFGAQWWFWGCHYGDGAARDLPGFLSILKMGPMEAVGWGLSEERAVAIESAIRRAKWSDGPEDEPVRGDAVVVDAPVSREDVVPSAHGAVFKIEIPAGGPYVEPPGGMVKVEARCTKEERMGTKKARAAVPVFSVGELVKKAAEMDGVVKDFAGALKKMRGEKWEEGLGEDKRLSVVSLRASWLTAKEQYARFCATLMRNAVAVDPDELEDVA